MPDLEKLPKWARDHIANLERQLDDIRGLAADVLGEEPKSFYVTRTAKIYEKMTYNKRYVDANVVYCETPSLEVGITHNEDGVLVTFEGKRGYDAYIEPRASNSILIVSVPRP